MRLLSFARMTHRRAMARVGLALRLCLVAAGFAVLTSPPAMADFALVVDRVECRDRDPAGCNFGNVSFRFNAADGTETRAAGPTFTGPGVQSASVGAFAPAPGNMRVDVILFTPTRDVRPIRRFIRDLFGIDDTVPGVAFNFNVSPTAGVIVAPLVGVEISRTVIVETPTGRTADLTFFYTLFDVL